MTHALSLSETEEKIAKRIDPAALRGLMVSDAKGGVAFADMGQVLELAKLMAVAGVAVPKHLRGNPGVCAAVCLQAIEWKMSPIAVANKSYSVNDRLAYEAQLIQAVVLQRAPIRGRIKVEYAGEGERRICRVFAELRDEPGEVVEYVSPAFARITPKNSPLWKSDPDQQLFYFSVRALCRRHFPDVLLGVYASDELEDYSRRPQGDIIPPSASLAQRLESIARGPKPPPEPDEPDEDEDDDEEQQDDGAQDTGLPLHDEDGVILEERSPDYLRGIEDRQKGLTKCVLSAIREDEARFAQWKAGYESVSEGKP